MSLDDLEGLVHHRGGVDGDLGAHIPNRMSESIIDGDLLQLLGRAARETAAAGSENDPGNFFPAACLQGLKIALCSLSTEG
jgi:hypothetical protein